MAIAKFDGSAIWVADPTVVTNGIGLLARLPDQTAGRLCFCCDGIHCSSAIHCKSRVTIILFSLVTPGSTLNKNIDLLIFAAGFCKPNDT